MSRYPINRDTSLKFSGDYYKSKSSLKSTSITPSLLRVPRINKSTISLQSSRYSNGSSVSSEMSINRKAHFDPANIEKTYKPKYKDYGYIKITQAATPFPHRTLGLDAVMLKPSKIFNEELRSEVNTTMPRAFSCTRLTRPLEMDFETQRKKFYEGEFTITRQRRPLQVHPPLKSIGDVANVRFQSSCQNLTKFFRKHYRQRDSYGEDIDD